jgi:predicted permease
LRATPGLTLTAILTLALGIAASTTVFGWIDALLLDPIPGAARGGELVEIETLEPNGAPLNTAYRDYRDYRDSLKQVSGLAASLANVFTIGDERNPRLQWGEFVSANYFGVMGVKAIRGRTFLPEDGSDAPGGPPVVAIGERLWDSRYQRDPGVIGKKLRINRRDLTIVGVIPEAFHGAAPGLVFQVWLPFSLAPELNGQGPGLFEDRDARQMWLTGRLAPGVTVERARAEVVACARHMAEEHPQTNRGYGADLVPVWRGHAGAQALLREPLQILLAVSLVLFLIVAANVANLQIARGAARVKEFSIRLALGAGAARLVRQLLTESLLLAAAGGAAGALLAMWGGQALVWLLPSTDLPVEFHMPTNWHVLAFTMALCLAAAVLTGLAPALHALDASVNTRLKEGARGTTSGAARRTRALLVISEVALALVALVGTGLFALSFYHARAVDSGMDVRNVASAKYYVETFCHTRDERTRFSVRLGERLRALPGVTAVSYSDTIPLEFGDRQQTAVEVEGYVPAAGELVQTPGSTVAPGYFGLLRIPLLEGRDFSEKDDRDTAPVMIVNQAFARRYFGGGLALGRRVRTGGLRFTVIGMAADAKYQHLTEAATPYYYTAFRQTHGGEFWLAFFVRTAGPVRGALAGLDREAATVDPATRASNFVAYQGWMEASLYGQRVAATLVGVVGAISLILSAIGLYSVLAFAVSQRRNEFGIRMALGAGPWRLLATVLRQGLGLTAAGLGAGALAAFAAMRFAAGYLPKVKTSDPQVFAGAILVLTLVALLASYLPARRATRVDPVDALRQE